MRLEPKPAISESAINQMLENMDESKLSDWEKGFLVSARGWWKKTHKLSDKQLDRLKEMWEKQHKP